MVLTSPAMIAFKLKRVGPSYDIDVLEQGRNIGEIHTLRAAFLQAKRAL
jgi:hypothetical protein